MTIRIFAGPLAAVLLSGTPALADTVQSEMDAALGQPESQFRLVHQKEALVLGTLGSFGPSLAIATLPDARLVAGGADDQDKTRAVAEITAGSDGGRATIKIGHSTNWETGTDTATDLGVDTWALTLSAPVDKSGSTTIAGTGGLPNDFSIKLSFSQFIGSVKGDWFSGYDVYQLALQKCYATIAPHRTTEEILADTPPSDAEKKDAKARRDKTCGGPDAVEGPNANDVIAKFIGPAAASGVQNAVTGSTFMWGADISTGYNKFEYYNPMTAAKLNSTGTTWTAGGFLAWSPGADPVLISLGLQFARTYKPGSQGTLCAVPSPLPAVLTCVTGALGAPKVQEKFDTSLEFKREIPLDGVFKKVGLTALGFDAKFDYDVKNDTYGLDVPLSFVADKDGNLVGGIDVNWDSEKHNVAVGLFVSSAFSLFPG
ncbi:MAG TPA: hypothetical protein VHZ78_10825 [Rhizomicrobium sp.]|jgi:hypothetical protein|nr:hypothetical protein [Rhizomicrobium sp.]